MDKFQTYLWYLEWHSPTIPLLLINSYVVLAVFWKRPKKAVVLYDLDNITLQPKKKQTQG